MKNSGILTEHPKKIIVKTRESNLISFFALISSAALMWVFPINRRIGYRDVYQTKFTFQTICLQTFLSKEKVLADQCRYNCHIQYPLAAVETTDDRM